MFKRFVRFWQDFLLDNLNNIQHIYLTRLYKDRNLDNSTLEDMKANIDANKLI